MRPIAMFEPDAPAILALAAQAPLTTEQIDGFLRDHRVPIVEGRNCTLLSKNMSMRPSLLKSAMIESATSRTAGKTPLGAALSNSGVQGQMRVL